MCIRDSLNVSPVHNVPECLDVLALDVLVVQVECVLPHVQLQNGNQCNGDVALLVVKLLDDEALANGVPCEDCPAGALNGQCNVGEMCIRDRRRDNPRKRGQKRGKRIHPDNHAC